ncbi:MAG: CRTAC1 family protein [Acidobacteria bacterium]|nr:CRTAC1 family protein [Acidobacteriota bacterium]
MSPRATVAVLLISLCACGRAPDSSTAASASSSRPWFADASSRSGVSFVYRSGHESRYLLPEIVGGGAALFDMDGDGRLDIFLTQGGSLTSRTLAAGGSRLFRNRGDWTFDDVTGGSGAAVAGYGMGVTAGDYDNDGDTDLYVTRLGTNVLLQNDGRGIFRDVTSAAGVGGTRRIGESAWGNWSTSAAFVDIDADGDLDLAVARYLNWSPGVERDCYSASGERDYCDPNSYSAPAAAAVFRNDGKGTFTDISAPAGFRSAVGNGLGIIADDFNGDGRLDIFVANDGTPNHLWVNMAAGRFVEDALLAGCAFDQDGKAKAGMGVAAADIDNDGRVDLLVVNRDGEADSLYRNEGRYFVDVTPTAGLAAVSRPFTRFGSAFADFDNDGLLDLYEANGRVSRQSIAFSGDPFAEPNLLFRGVAAGRFEEVVPRGGTVPLLIATSRAAAFGDLDDDGGVDVLVVNRDAPVHVLRNVVPSRGHWIGFRVLEEHQRDALGAEVTLNVGGRRVRRTVQAAYSYLASNDPRVHVGLGDAAGVAAVTVRWADGTRELFGDFASGRYEVLRRGAGVVSQGTSLPGRH